MNLDHLPEPVAKQLRAFYRRKRLLGAARVLAATGAIYCLLVLAAVHIDRFWMLTQADRVLMWQAVHGAIAVIGIALWALWYRRRGSTTALAYELERSLGSELNERIVTLHSLSEPRATSAGSNVVREQLLEQLRHDTISMSENLDAASGARDAKLKPRLIALSVCLLLHALLFIPGGYQYALMLQRFWQPRADLAKPSFVQLSVEPAELVVGVGGEAVIQAETTGEMPAIVAWIMEQLGTATTQCEITFGELGDDELLFTPGNTETMTRIQRTLYLYSQSDLRESFRFRIRYGDAVTRTHLVRVVPQPMVTRIALQVTPPPYSGLPAETIENPSGPISLLPETAVIVSFTTDQETTSQELLAEGEDEPLELEWDAATRTGTYAFTMEKAMALSLTVANAEGFTNVDKAELIIGLREDEAPSVRLESPTADLERVPGDLVPLRLVIEDDLGLVEAAIRYQLNPSRNPDASFQELPLDLGEAPGKRLELNPSLDLDATGATPGDELLVQVRARDSAGNDGQTRPLIIRIVAFTRGENERRRLAVLRTLRQSLAVLAELPEDADAAAELPGGDGIDGAQWEAILKLATDTELALPEAPSFGALLQLLEYEVHFTDRPRHKTDLRLLYGQLLRISEQATTASERAAALRPMVDSQLPRLTAARRVQNLATRLFGLRAEAEDIRRTLQELDAAGDDADKDRERAVKRRAKLYLDVLQNLGDELIGLAEELPDLDADAILEIQGELNTQAYYLTRGSISRRLGGVEEVLVQLDKLSTLLAPSLPALLAAELDTRAALQAAHDAIYAADDASAAWLAADGRLLDLNPYVTQVDRGRNLVALQARAAGQGAPPSVRDLPAATRDQRRIQATLARRWEWQTFGARSELSDAERLFVAWALRLDQDWSGEPPDHRSLAASTKAFETAMANPSAATIPTLRLSPPETRLPQVDGLVSLPDLPAAMDEILARIQTASDASSVVSAAMMAVEPEPAGPAVAALHDAMMAVDSSLSLTVDLLSYQQRFEPVLDGDAVTREYHVLRLRAAQLRFQLQSAPAMAVLATARDGELDAGALARLQSEVTRLNVLRDALASIITQVRDETPDLADARQRYPILADYERSRLRLGLTRALAAPDADPQTTAQAYLAAFPQAGMDYLSTETSTLARLIDALESAQDALERAEPDVAAYSRNLEQAADASQTLVAAAAAVGDSEDVTAIRESLDRVSVRLQRLRITGTPEPNVLRRRLFDLSETLPLTERLLRDLQSYRADRGAAGDDFRGGPAGIWEDATHGDADVARRRLAGQVLLAEDRVTQAMLSHLSAATDALPSDNDSPIWAMHLHRVIRSPLAGPVRTQPKSGGGERGADKFLDWLQQNLADSKKIVQNREQPDTYDAVTLEYLESLSDFLRY